jgi:hypothetical protein
VIVLEAYGVVKGEFLEGGAIVDPVILGFLFESRLNRGKRVNQPLLVASSLVLWSAALLIFGERTMGDDGRWKWQLIVSM